MATTKKTGKFQGKSNTLGQGGRAAQLKSQGVPGGVIGDIARAKGAAPGQKNFHRTKKRTAPDANNQTSSSPAESGNSLRKRAGMSLVRTQAIGKSAGTLPMKPMLTKTMGSKPSGSRPAFASGVGFGSAAQANPGRVTQDTSTPMMAAGKGYMPAGKLDAGGVPMKRKRSMPQRKTHRTMKGGEMLSKAMKPFAK